jgi:hypothetical protein
MSKNVLMTVQKDLGNSPSRFDPLSYEKKIGISIFTPDTATPAAALYSDSSWSFLICPAYYPYMNLENGPNRYFSYRSFSSYPPK